VYEQTKLIQDKFDEITVISPQPYWPSFLQMIPSLAGYSKLSGFRDYRIGKMRVYYPTYFTLPIRYLREKNYLYMARAIEETIRRYHIEYDVAHVHFLYPTAEAAMEIVPGNIPRILSMHGGDVYVWVADPKHTQDARTTWRAYNRLHVPSKYLADELIRLDPDLDRNKIFVIPPSVDSKLFYPKLKKNNSKTVLMVANLVEGKGHLDGLEAFKKVLNVIPEARLKIIGTGPQYSVIKQRIEEMGLDREVELVGAVAHAKLGKWYREAAVLMFPSYTESFGIVQIEAMACGLPVVAYANEGSREVLAEYPQCLVKIGDVGQLSQKLLQVLSGQIKPISTQKILAKYSANLISKKLNMLYLPHAEPDQICNKTTKT